MRRKWEARGSLTEVRRKSRGRQNPTFWLDRCPGIRFSARMSAVKQCYGRFIQGVSDDTGITIFLPNFFTPGSIGRSPSMRRIQL